MLAKHFEVTNADGQNLLEMLTESLKAVATAGSSSIMSLRFSAILLLRSTMTSWTQDLNFSPIRV